MTLEEETSTASKFLGVVIGFSFWAIFVITVVWICHNGN